MAVSPLVSAGLAMNLKIAAQCVLTGGVAAISATVSASNRTSVPCIAGKRAALVRGHFTGPFICSKDATFVLVGRTHGAKFSIYDYRYRYLTKGGNVMHGGQKIVVFNSRVYIGQYALSPPPYESVSVSGADILVRGPSNHKGVVLDFSRAPPKQILVDGYVATFSR